MQIIVLIAGVLLPPLGVAKKEGLDQDSWVNVIPTIILSVSGVIHSNYFNFLR